MVPLLWRSWHTRLDTRLKSHLDGRLPDRCEERRLQARLALEDLRRRPLRDDATTVDDHEPIAPVLDLVKPVRGEQDRPSIRAEAIE
jgi:hypothetical protein